ncbi:MAG: ABC transporter ATP-binding protein [Clostridia bacterium]|nr:ABC transporter ATP-binding protein [Clostridia bacterium]
MPPARMRGDGRKAKDPKKTLLRLLSYMKKHIPVLCLVLVCIFMATYAQTTGSAALGVLVDDFILPMVATGEADYGPLAAYLVRIACIFGAGIVCAWLYNFLMVGVSQSTQRRIRNELFTKMQKLPLRYFDSNKAGNIMSRYTSDIDTLNQMLGQSIPQCASSIITLVVVLVRLIITSPILTCVMIITVTSVVFVTKTLAGRSMKYFIGQQKSLGAVNGYIEEMINGQKVVKVFNHEEKCKVQFDELNQKLCENAYTAGKYSNIMGPINNNLGYVQYAVLAIVGGTLAVTSGGEILTLGNLMTFMLLSRTFNMPISQISNQINAIVMALAGAERIFDLMDQQPEEDDGKVTLVNIEKDENGAISEVEHHTGHWGWRLQGDDGSISYRELKGDITLKNVDFSYVPNKTVLNDVSLWAHPGQKIAFVGATGAGKTTITNLLNRFYDIEKGSITYDGIEIKDICKSDLRQSLGMVLQETHLFTGTVMDNIRYGKLDASDEECIEAAKLANAHDFITRLPEGYDTMLTGNGASLSQGQRQLIAIARAAVADPPAMILDEATSSIDTRTEALVQKGMDALMHGRTTFVIAHRLSTVRNADCIMVLSDGRIIERGNHNELIEQKGTYYKLYTGAFELE